METNLTQDRPGSAQRDDPASRQALQLGAAFTDPAGEIVADERHYSPMPATTFGGSSELVAACRPYSDEADAFRDLRRVLQEGMAARGRRPLAVLSPDAGDGKSYLAANLAITFAQVGTTLLIDANMRSPRVHSLFGLGTGPGLGDVLTGPITSNVITSVADVPGLHLLPAGHCDDEPLQLLHGPRFGLLLQEVMHRFDMVIVDTQADSLGPDGRTVAARAGAALLVGRRARTRSLALRTLSSRLQKSRAAVTGLVVNEY